MSPSPRTWWTRLATVVPLLAGLALTAPGPAHADGLALAGTVRDSAGPVRDAFVAITGAAGQTTALTDDEGRYAVASLPAGSYAVSAQAAGHRVASAQVTVADAGGAEQSFTLEASGTALRSLPFYGAYVAEVLPGGVPGVFYARTSVIPSLFRTADHGGHWAPVTLAVDDPVHGLGVKMPITWEHSLAVSGHPGEVAAYIDEILYYSRDFGVTWTGLRDARIRGGAAGNRQVFWGHAGDTSTILVRDGSATYLVDMTNPTRFVPTLAYHIGTADKVEVANAGGRSWVGVLNATGTLRLRPLTPTGPGDAPAVTVTGLPSGDNFLRLGGTAEPGLAPSAALVYGYDSRRAVLALKDPQDAAFEPARAAAATLTSRCVPGWMGHHARASLAPNSGGTTGFGTVGQCMFQAIGGVLAEREVDRMSGGFGYGTGYGTGDDHVILTPDVGRGIIKSVAADGDGWPLFDHDREAAPGTGADAGGVAVNGLAAAEVTDTAYGPTANDIASALSMSAGGLAYASNDGGATSHIAVKRGGSAVTWWRGPTDGSSWLLFGHGGHGDLLSAFSNWTPDAAPLDAPNLAGTSNAMLGDLRDPMDVNIGALLGVPGTNSVFVGVGNGFHNSSADQKGGDVVRVELGMEDGAPIVTDIDPIGPYLSGMVTSLAYCPAGTAGGGDVLYAGVDRGNSGKVLKVTDATGDAPQVRAVATAYPVHKVQADCVTGAVWAATGMYTTGGPTGALLRSTDGGATFAPVTISVSGGPFDVTAIALNPADPAELVISANRGLVLRTTDTGASWTVLNDPASAGPSLGTVVDAELPPTEDQVALSAGTASAAAAASARTGRALLGSGSGAFAAVRAAYPNGLYGASDGSGGWSAADRVLGTGSSAARPALVSDPAGNATLVYAGADGLYTARRPAGRGWTRPARLTGTRRGDGAPVLARTGTGLVYLAFVRGKAGVHRMTRTATGAWTPPKRLSSNARDSVPALAVDRAGKAHVVFRRTGSGAGLYYATNRTGSWSTPARIRKTAGGDGTPALAVAGTSVRLAFVRGGNVYTGTKNGGAGWSKPARRTVGAAASAPDIAVDPAGTTYLVYRRPHARGLYLLTTRGGHWGTPTRIAGTVGADAGPTVVVAGGRLHLAFQRGGATRPGVYTASRPLAGAWTAPQRRSTSARDATPAIAVDGSGHVLAVFDRG